MSDGQIRWYGMTSDLKTEEHEPIALAQALQIVDEHFAHADEKFESAEAALAATMFGFSRSKSEFIEICINGSTQISYRFEMSDPDASWVHKMFGGVFQYEEELQSKDALIRKVEEFFTLQPREIRSRLQQG